MRRILLGFSAVGEIWLAHRLILASSPTAILAMALGLVLITGIASFLMKNTWWASLLSILLNLFAMGTSLSRGRLIVLVALAGLAWMVGRWSRRRPKPGLVVSDGFFGIGLLILVSTCLSGAVSLRVGAIPAHQLSLLVALYLATPPMEVLVMLFVLWHAGVGRDFFRENYVWTTRSWGFIGFGLVAGIGLSVLTAVVVALEQRMGHVNIRPNNPFVFSPGLSAHAGLAAFFIGLAVIVMAPIAEEALFRGILFGSLTRSWGYPWATLTAGLVFGAAHMNWTLFPALALAGIILNAIYYRTRSLIPSTVAHATLNGLSVFMALRALH